MRTAIFSQLPVRPEIWQPPLRTLDITSPRVVSLAPSVGRCTCTRFCSESVSGERMRDWSTPRSVAHTPLEGSSEPMAAALTASLPDRLVNSSWQICDRSAQGRTQTSIYTRRILFSIFNTYQRECVYMY